MWLFTTLLSDMTDVDKKILGMINAQACSSVRLRPMNSRGRYPVQWPLAIALIGGGKTNSTLLAPASSLMFVAVLGHAASITL